MTARMLARVAVTFVLAAACGARQDSVPTERAQGPAVSFATIDELFGASGQPLGDAARDAQTPVQFRQLVRARLANALTYRTLALKLFGLLTINDAKDWQLVWELQTAKTTDGRDFFFALDPCAPADLVPVRAWWQPDRDVLICKGDYLPVLRDGERFCDSYKSAPTAGCRCGPHLLFCAPGGLGGPLAESSFDEIRWTLEEVVSKDRPFRDLLVMNETVRDGKGEFFYARNRFFQTGQLERINLDAPRALRPREPHFDGGLLTTPFYLFVDTRRVIMGNLWQDFLCKPFRSARVDPHILLEANRNAASLRFGTHVQLAHTRGCENCHVRLEYGQLAFNGWHNAFIGQHFDPTVHVKDARVRFYVRDHNDMRGEGPATPAWLGLMFAEQPEFATCVVDKITSFVFEGYEIPDEVSRELATRFRKHQRLAPLIEDAVIARSFGIERLRNEAAAGEAPR